MRRLHPYKPFLPLNIVVSPRTEIADVTTVQNAFSFGFGSVSANSAVTQIKF